MNDSVIYKYNTGTASTMPHPSFSSSKVLWSPNIYKWSISINNVDVDILLISY